MGDPYRTPSVMVEIDFPPPPTMQPLPRLWYRACAFCPKLYGVHAADCDWAAFVNEERPVWFSKAQQVGLKPGELDTFVMKFSSQILSWWAR